MKVKDLIEALSKCDQEALACVEVNGNPVAKEIVQYEFPNGEKNVYIADSLEYVDTVINESKKVLIFKEEDK